MSNSLSILPSNLLDKISEDFFDAKEIKFTADELAFQFKEQLSQFGITDLDFMTPKQLLECMCIIKNIDYEKEYKKTKLTDLFVVKSLFTHVVKNNLVRKFDADEVHNKILESLLKTCNSLSVNKDKYTVQIKTGRTTKYIIQKNNKDKYLTFQPSLFESEVYMRIFMPLDIDILKHELPESLKRTPVEKHTYAPKLPFLEGFLIKEFEELIILLEQYESENMA